MIMSILNPFFKPSLGLVAAGVLAASTSLAQTGALRDFSERRFLLEAGGQLRDREAAQRDREADLYNAGQEALEEDRWDRAIDRFRRCAELKGAHADGALYWQAYAHSRLGDRPAALSTIAQLLKAYPESGYVKQAQALEQDLRRQAGQPVRPEDQPDDDLKLYAINALQHMDPAAATEMLATLLQGNNSPRVKARALFVLAQNSSPRARQIIGDIARGNTQPDLQRRAINYLGVHGGRENRELLADIYSSSSNVDVRKAILSAFMVSGERQRLLQAATTEQVPELRGHAVDQLGVMGAHDELWQLYQKETDAAVKKQIINAMFVGGNATRLVELAKGERDPELRRSAVNKLGLMGASRTGAAIVEIYASDKDPAIRKEALNSLFLQNNAEALVAIARKETDPAMKKTIVQKLSLMGRNKAALDYLMEILK
jgi:hypothetical protein